MDKVTTKEELIFHLSDLHIGEVVKLPSNKYNQMVAKHRLEYYFDKVLHIAKNIYGQVIPIEKIHIILTGDMLHNETMRGSAKMSADLNIVEQIECASELVVNGMKKMATWPTIKEINVYAVRGNHGRIGKPADNADDANYDIATYNRMKLEYNLAAATNKRLSEIKNKFMVATNIYLPVKICGWNFVLEHLDGVKGQLGIPYYGITRRRDLRYKTLQGKMDYYLGGHFHRCYKEDDGTVTTLLCPSLVGANSYGEYFGYGNVSGQMMYLIHPKHGITVDRFINTSHIQE